MTKGPPWPSPYLNGPRNPTPHPFLSRMKKTFPAFFRGPTASMEPGQTRIPLAETQAPHPQAPAAPEEAALALRPALAPRPKKRYRRHPKPPYSYLGMIALVIQGSPERKLKLCQIIPEIRQKFPSFKMSYQGWKDSIRHNLSNNPCFSMELKDPTNPKAKGNYWTVDVRRIPLEVLKLQNTSVSRREGAAFVPDLSPYVLHGQRYSGCRAPGAEAVANGGGGPEGPPPPRLKSTFSIESLLQDVPRAASDPGPERAAGSASPPAGGREQPGPSRPASPPLFLHAGCKEDSALQPKASVWPQPGPPQGPQGQLPGLYRAAVFVGWGPPTLPMASLFAPRPSVPLGPATSSNGTYWSLAAGPPPLPMQMGQHPSADPTGPLVQNPASLFPYHSPPHS